MERVVERGRKQVVLQMVERVREPAVGQMVVGQRVLRSF